MGTSWFVFLTPRNEYNRVRCVNRVSCGVECLSHVCSLCSITGNPEHSRGVDESIVLTDSAAAIFTRGWSVSYIYTTVDLMSNFVCRYVVYCIPQLIM